MHKKIDSMQPIAASQYLSPTPNPNEQSSYRDICQLMAMPARQNSIAATQSLTSRKLTAIKETENTKRKTSADHLLEVLQNGEMQLFASLKVRKGMLPPPQPSFPVFEHLSQLPKGEITTGPSLLLHLFDDYLNAHFSKFYQVYSNPGKANIGIWKKFGKMNDSLSRKLNENMGKIQLAMGYLSEFLFEGNPWWGPIKTSPVQDYKQLVANALEELEGETGVDNVFRELLLEEVHGQKFIEALDLFKVVIRSDVSVLFSPLEHDPFLNNNLKRLKQRIEILKDSFENFKHILPYQNPFFKNYSNKKLFEKEKEYITEFCDRLIQIIDEIDSNPDKQHALYKELYHYIYDKHERALRNNLGKEIRDRKKTVGDPDSKEFFDLCVMEQLFNAMDYKFQSILNEGLLTALNHVICLDQVEIDEYIVNIAETIKEFNNASYEDINTRLDEIDPNTLTEEEEIYFNNLKKCWKDLFLTSKTFYTRPLFENIQLRMALRQQSASPNTQRALALRDGLVGFKLELTETIRNVHKYLNSYKCHDLQSIPLQEISEHILEIVQTQNEAFSTALEAMENLLDGCFTRHEILENERALEHQKQEEEKLKQLEAQLKAAERIAEENKQQLEIEVQAEKKNKSQKRKAQRQAKRAAAKKLQISPEPSRESKAVQQLPAPTHQPKVMEVQQTVNADPLPQPSQAVQQPLPPPQNLKDMLKWTIKEIHQCLPGLRSQQVKGELEKEFRQTWLTASLHNLNVHLTKLGGMQKDPQFSIKKIYGEQDAMRLILESAMETILALYPAESGQGSILHQALKYEHELKFLGRDILWQKQGIIPGNVAKIVHANWQFILLMTKANICLNYPHSLEGGKSVPPDAVNLMAYLHDVQHFAKITDEEVRDQCLDRVLSYQDRVITQGLIFVYNLFKAVENPDDSVLSLPLPEFDFQEEITAGFLSSVREEECDVPIETSCTTTSIEPILTRPIRSRGSALIAIDQALMWIRITMLKPIEGCKNFEHRMQQRNQSLKNTVLYLQRLKEIMTANPDHSFYYYMDELELLRRALKELNKASLLHGNFFGDDGLHIVDARRLAKENNPCELNRILRSLASAPHAPSLDHLPWLEKVHATFTYPMPVLGTKRTSSAALELGKLAQQIKRVLTKQRKLSQEESMMIKGEVVTHKKLQQEKEKFVHSQESQKVFEALGLVLSHIRHGFRQ